MIEWVMYFGIGFLAAALLGLLLLPAVHNRAVRLTMKRLEASTPLGAGQGDKGVRSTMSPALAFVHCA